MCVIIHREPNIVIPHEKLVSACLVNADGMGVVAFDRGKLEVRKVFDTAGNNVDVLERFLEQAKDLNVYVHLRYRTKGDTDKSNVHPFGMLKSKWHGMDVQFMHNGTLSDFGTKTDCDSKHFVKTFLTPLSEKLLKAIPPDVLLHDPTFIEILKKYAGRSSVFLLADSFGNHRIINYDEGKEFDGWWASNDYSFNAYHRTPKTEYKYLRDSDVYRKADDWKPTRRDVQTEDKKVTLVQVPKTYSSAGTPASTFNDEIPWKEETKGNVTEVANKASVVPTLPKRERFIDDADIGDLSVVCQLTRNNIEELVEEYPDRAVLLILDLLEELYNRDMEADDSLYEAA